MYKSLLKTQAHTVTFAALFIPVLIVLIGLIVDGGMLFVKKAELQSMADNASSAGISTLTDQMLSIVETKVAAEADVEMPTAILSMIDDTDRILLSQSTIPSDIAYDFIESNNFKDLILEERYVIYPYDYNPGDSNISLKVELESNHSFYFVSVLGITQKNISAESIASIQIK